MSASRAEAARIARAARSSAGTPSHGLLRFRRGHWWRTFNAPTKTPMAHLRKKEKWLDHARAMIEGKSLAKTAELCGVHPNDGLPLAASVSPRARFRQAPMLRGHRRGTRPSSSNPSRADGPTCRERRGSGPETARHPGLHQDNNSRSRRSRPEGRDLRRRLASGRQRFGGNRARRRRHAEQPSHRRRRPGDRRFRSQGGDSLPRRAVAGKAGSPRPPAPAHLINVNAYHSRLKQWLTQRQRRRHQELRLNHLGWLRRPRSLGRSTGSTKLDQRRYRKRSLPTPNAIRARNFFAKIRIDGIRLPSGQIEPQTCETPGARNQETGISYFSCRNSLESLDSDE